MVNLTRIYTRTGDDGTTSLGDMSRTGKNDPRLRAYADVDEANCVIGLGLATAEFDPGIRDLLMAIQNDLFDVGADLCTPVVDEPAHPPLRVTEDYVERLEKACDDYNATLEPLRSFVLPGGTPAAAARAATTGPSARSGTTMAMPSTPSPIMVSSVVIVRSALN